MNWKHLHRAFLRFFGGVPESEYEALRVGAKEFVWQHFDAKPGRTCLDADGEELSHCVLTDTDVVIIADDCALTSCAVRGGQIFIAPWCRWTVIEGVRLAFTDKANQAQLREVGK